MREKNERISFFYRLCSVVIAMLLVSISIFSSVQAQQQSLAFGRNCATMEVLERQLAEDPELGQRLDTLEEFTESYIAQRKAARSLDFTPEAVESVRIIPVYVHVLYQTAGGSRTSWGRFSRP